MNRQYDNRGRDQVNIEHFHQSPLPARPDNESLLLEGVKREVRSRLKQSLHNAVPIALDKQTQPERVRCSLDAQIKSGSKPSELLLGISILQVFDRDDIGGKLLILGEPGSGKTTTMLDLTRDLLQRAETDINYRIPVLLNLSSWQNPRQAMKDWLVEELESNYGVREDIGEEWLKNRKLLPLLDGLDEVRQEYQVSCVRAINSWLQSKFRPLYIVVCSRREEYEKVVQGHWQEAKSPDEETDRLMEEIRLNLSGAILLKKLTDEQIQEYLESLDLLRIWQVLRLEAETLELMRTPLFLSIIGFAYDNKNFVRTLQRLTSNEARLEYLFNEYWSKAIKRPLVSDQLLLKGIKSQAYGKCKYPDTKQTRKWLVYLAKQLQQESQTEFLIEKIQPSWLLIGKQKRLYQLINVLINVLFFGLSFGLSFGLIFGLIFGLSFGLIGRLQEKIEIVERFSFSFEKLKNGLINVLIGGLIGGLIFGLSGGLSGGLIEGLIFGLIFGLSFGLIGGLSFGLIGGLIGGMNFSEINIKRNPNQGIWRSAVNALCITLISGLIFGLIGGLSFGLTSGLIGGLTSGLSFGLIFGGTASIKHLTLRLILFKNGHIPWNYARFLDYCTERLFLQRVGGRYRFIHKQLQDHFAQM